MNYSLASLVLLLVLAVTAFGLYKSGYRPPLPYYIRNVVDGYRYGFRVERNVMIPMTDGVRLAANVYMPKQGNKFGTVLVRLPYNKDISSPGIRAATYFSQRGYVTIIEDVRGKYASGGVFAPWHLAAEDGASTLDWIVQQPWSNGKVGTFGCSALGETQMLLARLRNPHHSAMITEGAGGAMGSALGRYTYFGVFEGGIFNLASGFGWFSFNGQKNGGSLSERRPIDVASALRELPIVSLVDKYQPEKSDYPDFLTHPPGDPWWREMGYVDDSDQFVTPAIHVNSWSDQTVADTLALAELAQRNAPGGAGLPNQHVIIGPGNHCAFEEEAAAGAVGDLKVENGSQPIWDWYEQWFAHYLHEPPAAPLPSLPPYRFFVLGENRWLDSGTWPPEKSHSMRWYLSSGGRANSASGDGQLTPEAPAAQSGFDEYRYDPMDPVLSKGGPICCTGDPRRDRSGPVDQQEVEARPDVLVYTTPPLQKSVRIVGPVKARLVISTSARDTDFVAKLVDVDPAGRALNIQEGALRLRYRDGFKEPQLAKPGERYEIVVDMRATALYLAPGHRLRLQVTSSNFPRLERNLNTGGRNYDETVGVVAVNRVYHGPDAPSALEVQVLDDEDALPPSSAPARISLGREVGEPVVSRSMK